MPTIDRAGRLLPTIPRSAIPAYNRAGRLFHPVLKLYNNICQRGWGQTLHGPRHCTGAPLPNGRTICPCHLCKSPRRHSARSNLSLSSPCAAFPPHLAWESGMGPRREPPQLLLAPGGKRGRGTRPEAGRVKSCASKVSDGVRDQGRVKL